MGKYILRSIKCLFLVGFLFCAVVLIMFYTSEHEPDLKPWDLFKGNLTKVLIFFGAYAVVYPLIGYSKKDVAIGDALITKRQTIVNALNDMNLAEETDSQNIHNYMRFRNKSAIVKILRLGEDAVTLTESDGMLTIEGQRKDVVRVAMRIERVLTQDEDSKEIS